MSIEKSHDPIGDFLRSQVMQEKLSSLPPAPAPTESTPARPIFPPDVKKRSIFPEGPLRDYIDSIDGVDRYTAPSLPNMDLVLHELRYGPLSFYSSVNKTEKSQWVGIEYGERVKFETTNMFEVLTKELPYLIYPSQQFSHQKWLASIEAFLVTKDKGAVNYAFHIDDDVRDFRSEMEKRMDIQYVYFSLGKEGFGKPLPFGVQMEKHSVGKEGKQIRINLPHSVQWNEGIVSWLVKNHRNTIDSNRIAVDTAAITTALNRDRVDVLSSPLDKKAESIDDSSSSL